MKKYFIGAIVALIISIPFYTNAQSATQGVLNAWKVVSGYITPNNSANGVKVPSLASTGTPCVTVSSTGVFATSTCGGAGGSGTVTSVALTVPTGLTVAGSPVTTSGTLAISLGAGYVIPLQSTLDTFATYSYASSTFVSYPYASSTFPSFGYASSTFLTGVTADSPLSGNGTAASHLIFTNPGYILNSYASSTFVTYGYGTSTYATIALYPTYAYASSTYPSFSYASSTFVTNVTGSGNIASSGGLTPNITFTGVLPIANGGTATSSAPAANALLVGNGTNYDFTTLPSCSNTTTSKLLYNNSTKVFSCGTDQTGGGGSATTTITTNVQSDGPNFTFATSSATGLNLLLTGSGSTITFTPQLQGGYVIPLSASTTEWSTAYSWGNHAGLYTPFSYASSTFVTYGYGTSTYATIASYPTYTYASATFATLLNTPSYSYASATFPSFSYASSTFQTALTTGNLTASSPLQFDNTRQVIGGAAVVSVASGYNIPLTASTTNWNTFYDTPSNRITAGTNLSWSGNTLNGTMASSTIIAGGTATHSPSITFATSTDTNLLTQIVCASATCTFTPQWTGTLAAGRLNSNVVQAITNDTNVTGSISAQNLTLGWTGVLAVSRGGTASTTAAGARFNLGVTKLYYTVGSADADFITTGTNDHVAFNNAINAASAVCGTVFVKSGQYYFGSSSSNYGLVKPCVTVEGENASSTVINGGNVEYSNNSTSVGVLTTSAPGSGPGVSTATTTNSRITIKNLTINTQKGYSLTMFNGTNWDIDNVETHAATTTLLKAAVQLRYGNTVNVNKLFMYDNDGNGLNIHAIEYFTVSNSGCFRSYDDCFDFDYNYGDDNNSHSRYGRVYGNFAKGLQSGGAGNGFRFENSDYIEAWGNHAEGFDPVGFWVGNDSRKGGDVTSNITLHNNTSVGNIVAGYMTENVNNVTSTVSNINFFNNKAINNGTNAGTDMRGGIILYASTTVGSWQTVRGNRIDKVAKTDDSGGIVVRANNVIVEGNSVNDAPYAYHLWNGSGTVTYTNVFFRNNFAASTTAEYYNENNALTQAGVTTQVYTNAGRFGIATTTGASTFTVQGTGLFSGNLTLAGITGSTQCLHVDSNGVISGAGGDCALSGGVPGKVARWTSATTLSTGILFDNSSVVGINASSSTITLNVQGTAGAFDPFNVASSSGTSYLRVLQGGNVGIGQSNPAQKLQVTAGNISIDNAQQVYFNGSADTNWRFGRNTTSTGDFTHLINTSASLNAIISSNSNEGFSVGASGGSSVFEVSGAGTGYFSGNVGIGTSTPAAKLSVVGTAGNNTIFNIATSTGASVLSVTPGLQVLVAANARFTVPQGTTPTLSAAGDIAVDTDNGGMLSFYSGGRENLYGTTTIEFVQKEPSASDDHKVNAWNGKDVPITITKVVCRIVGTGNTPSYTFSLPHGTSLGTASANAMTSGQACTSSTTPQSITIAGDLTLAANEALWATSSAMSNASTVYITISFKHDN